MTDTDLPAANEQTFASPGGPQYVVVHPFEDMPGTHRNEAAIAGKLGVWAACLFAAALLVPLGLVQLSEPDSNGINSSRDLAPVLGTCLFLGGLILAALAWNGLCKHQLNAYVLQVAVARNSGALEGFDVNSLVTTCQRTEGKGGAVEGSRGDEGDETGHDE